MTPPKLLRLLIAAGLVGALVFVAVGARADTGPSLTWSTVTPAHAPSYLSYAAGAYDPATKTFVMFGGIGANGVMSGATWVWNGNDWTQPAYSGGPSPRDLASIGFDAELDQFVLFGGQNAQGTLLSDTWTWNGTSWYQISSSVPAPTPRDGATLAYDHNGRLVLFGGTGYVDNSSGSPVGTGGGVAPSAEMTMSDTWLWQGSTQGWTQAKVPGPTARSGAVAAYDPQDATTVLFGGESNPASAPEQPQILDDTWLWDGKSWTMATPATAPPARFAAVADYFGPLGGPVVAGGYGASGDLSDTWLWQGGNWIQVSDQGSNPARQGAAGGYDAGAGELVEFGGGSGGTTLDLTSVAKLPTVSPPSTTTTTLTSTSSTTVGPKPGATTTSTTLAGQSGGGRPPSSPTTAPGPAPKPPTGPTPVVNGPTLTTASSRVARGGHLTLQGEGFAPGATIALTLHSNPASLGTIRAAADGRFEVSVLVPATAATGAHQVSAAGPTRTGKVQTAWADVSVYAPAKVLSTQAKTFLLGLALLIPVAAYTIMVLYGLWRDGRATRVKDPGNGPRSPS